MSYEKTIREDNITRIFILICSYLFFEYGRPQAFFPPIGVLRPAMIIQLMILYYVAPLLLTIKFKEPQTKAFIFLLVLMLPHVFLARNNYWAFNTLKIMFLYFVIYMAIVNFITEYFEIRKLINIWLMIIFLCGLIGIFYGGRIPGSSIMGDENDFSLVMNMAIPIAYFFGLETSIKKEKFYYFGAVGVFVVSVIISFSRGGFVGLAAVGLYCWIKSPKKIVSSFIIGIFIIIASLSAPESYWKEVQSITDENIEKGTGATRWYTWQCGWRMFLDHPIFGVGQGNFPWNFERYEPDEGFQGRLHGGRAAHSLYFTLIPELGIIGTFLFFYLAYKSMKTSAKIIFNIKELENEWRRKNDIAQKESVNLKFILYGLRGALIGYLVSGIFLSVLYYPHFWIISGIFVCIFNWWEEKQMKILHPDASDA